MTDTACRDDPPPAARSPRRRSRLRPLGAGGGPHRRRLLGRAPGAQRVAHHRPLPDLDGAHRLDRQLRPRRRGHRGRAARRHRVRRLRGLQAARGDGVGARPRAATRTSRSRIDALVAPRRRRAGAGRVPAHRASAAPGQRARYTDLEWGHELYCFGHLIQAAVARLRTGHDDLLVDVARRLADHVYREFGPDGRDAICGHPEIETGAGRARPRHRRRRATSSSRGCSSNVAGDGTLTTTLFQGSEYFLDDHAGARGRRCCAGMPCARSTSRPAPSTSPSKPATPSCWRGRAPVGATPSPRRTYLTGGIGSHHQNEEFGDDFELPPDRAYAETCAAIGSVMLSWRLLLQTGDAKYADLDRAHAAQRRARVAARGRPRVLLREHAAPAGARGRAGRRRAQRARGGEPARALVRGLVLPDQRRADARERRLLLRHRGRGRSAGAPVRRPGCGHDARATASRWPFGCAPGIRSTAARVTVVRADVHARAARPGVDARARTRRGSTARRWRIRWSATGTLTLTRSFRRGDVVGLAFDLVPRASPCPPRGSTRCADRVAVERGPLVLCLESVDLPEGRRSRRSESTPGRAPGDGRGCGRQAERRRGRRCGSAWPYAPAHGPDARSALRSPTAFDARVRRGTPAVLRVGQSRSESDARLDPDGALTPGVPAPKSPEVEERADPGSPDQGGGSPHPRALQMAGTNCRILARSQNSAAERQRRPGRCPDSATRSTPTRASRSRCSRPRGPAHRGQECMGCQRRRPRRRAARVARRAAAHSRHGSVRGGVADRKGRCLARPRSRAPQAAPRHPRRARARIPVHPDLLVLPWRGHRGGERARRRAGPDARPRGRGRKGRGHAASREREGDLRRRAGTHPRHGRIGRVAGSRLAWDNANFVQVGVRPFTDAYAMLRPYVDYLQVKDAVAATGVVVPGGAGRRPAARDAGRPPRRRLHRLRLARAAPRRGVRARWLLGTDRVRPRSARLRGAPRRHRRADAMTEAPNKRRTAHDEKTVRLGVISRFGAQSSMHPAPRRRHRAEHDDRRHLRRSTAAGTRRRRNSRPRWRGDTAEALLDSGDIDAVVDHGPTLSCEVGYHLALAGHPRAGSGMPAGVYTQAGRQSDTFAASPSPKLQPSASCSTRARATALSPFEGDRRRAAGWGRSAAATGSSPPGRARRATRAERAWRPTWGGRAAASSWMSCAASARPLAVDLRMPCLGVRQGHVQPA